MGNDFISPSARRIGILGAGQLATMLQEAAQNRLHQSVQLYSGTARDSAALQAFFSSVDLVLFENEFLDTALLRSAAQKAAQASATAEVEFFPSLELIARVQDKLEQKRIFDQIAAPHPAYRVLTSADEVASFWRAGTAAKILKWSRQGYDGKGVLKVTPQSTTSEIHNFFAAAAERQSQIYAEDCIDFASEVALVATRARSGEMTFYPLVKTIQSQGICERVLGPATGHGIPTELEVEARNLARSLAQALDIRGTFAIEFFVTRDQHLLINEIAPRVHNSGHCTQESARTSQFENHLRAAWDLSPGSPEFPSLTGEPATTYFGMLNFLGPADFTTTLATDTPPFPSFPISTAVSSSALHWYGKREIRPGRKLGHFNFSAPTAAAFSQALSEAEGYRQNCFEFLRKLSNES